MKNAIIIHNQYDLSQVIKIDRDLLYNLCTPEFRVQKTKSICIRKSQETGFLFLSERNNGNGGAGDICSININTAFAVNENLFNRIAFFAKKNNVLIN